MKRREKLRTLLLPVCWFRGHRPEGESIIKTQLPETNYIKRCGRCGRYILHSHTGEMTLTEKAAFNLRDRHEKALQPMALSEMEAQHV